MNLRGWEGQVLRRLPDRPARRGGDRFPAWAGDGLVDLLRSHWPFAVAMVLAALVRVLVQLAFPPALVFSDAPAYLGQVDSMGPGRNRPVGYGVLLRVVSWVSRDVQAIAITQHLLGLVTGLVIYAALRHWGVSRWPATLACLPVLFDAMQLLLEQSVLSDVLFDLVLLSGLVVLGWSRPLRVRTAAVAGLVLGLSVLVRLVAQPVVLPAALFCLLLTGAPVRARLVNAVIVTVAFLVPLAAYATWYHQVHGVWGLSEASGRALYMRTTTFVECDRIEIPEYLRPLCPPEPVGEREDPTRYGWHRLSVLTLDLPPGVTKNEATMEFAVAAIRAQPGDYLQTVLRDFWLGFWPWERRDHYELHTAYKWSFAARVDYEPTPFMSAPYLAHGGDLPRTRHPLGDWIADYGERVYVRGPVMLLMTLLGLAGLLARGAPTVRATRPLLFLLGSVALGLVLVPAVTAEFVWRYQLPAIMLLPMCAALGWTRLSAALRSREEQRRHRAPTARTAASLGAPTPD